MFLTVLPRAFANLAVGLDDARNAVLLFTGLVPEAVEAPSVRVFPLREACILNVEQWHVRLDQGPVLEQLCDSERSHLLPHAQDGLRSAWRPLIEQGVAGNLAEVDECLLNHFELLLRFAHVEGEFTHLRELVCLVEQVQLGLCRLFELVESSSELLQTTGRIVCLPRALPGLPLK